MQASQNSSVDHRRTAGNVIEVHISELDQLFNSLDPSPFHVKQLDDDAEEYIINTARELHGKSQLTLVVHLDRPVGLPDEESLLGQAIRDHFFRRYKIAQQKLRQLLRHEWFHLAIGLTLLGTSVLIGEMLARSYGTGPLATVLRESLLIGGWVAMWRPAEFFFYELWEKRRLVHHYQWLSQIAVRIVYSQEAAEAGAANPLRPATQPL